MSSIMPVVPPSSRQGLRQKHHPLSPFFKTHPPGNAILLLLVQQTIAVSCYFEVDGKGMLLSVSSFCTNHGGAEGGSQQPASTDSSRVVCARMWLVRVYQLCARASPSGSLSPARCERARPRHFSVFSSPATGAEGERASTIRSYNRVKVQQPVEQRVCHTLLVPILEAS